MISVSFIINRTLVKTGKVYFPEFQQLIVVYFFKYVSSPISKAYTPFFYLP